MKRAKLSAAIAVLAVLPWIVPHSIRAAAPDVIPHAQDRPPGPPLTPAEAIARMTVPEGFAVELVACEPDLVNPVAMTFDERGRVWITESLEYPRAQAGEGRDRIKILEDTDADGRADKFTVFAEGLNIPSGIAVGYGGVWVGNAPDILFLKDADGDDRADEREVVVTGFGRHDTHELPNSLTWGPDGWLYGLNGVFNPSVVEQGGRRFEFTCALFRIHPRTREFQLFAEGTSNPWGVAWDDEGSAFVSACVIDHLWHLVESGYYLRQGGPYPPFTVPAGSIVDHKHQKAAYCGLHFFDSDAYPSEYRGRLYMGNIHGNCINVDALRREGASYVASTAADFLSANDAWFMPVVQKTGPDGCLYILDWYDRYHCYQDARRDPEGIDRLKGRLYRVRYRNTPRAPRFNLAAESDAQLIGRLHSPNVFFRDLAQRILCERDHAATRSALERLVLDSAAQRKARMHALWTLVGTGSLAEEFHLALLAHDDASYRAWGVRAAGNFGKVGPRVRDQIISMAGDPSPDVRLQVAIAAKKIEGIDAMPLLVNVLISAGDDKLVRHVVWQNLQSLLEEHGSRYLQLTSQRAFRDSPAVAALLPQVVERILGSRHTDAIGGLVEALAAEATIDAEALARCLAALAERLKNREISAEQLASLRPRLDPFLQKILAQQAGDAVYLNAVLVATTWNDARAVAAARAIMGDPERSSKLRAQALSALVAAADDGLAVAVDALLGAPQKNPVQWRGAVLDAVARADAPWVARVILQNYEKLEPELRPRAIEVLTERPGWAEQLLEAIGRDQIPASALNANQVRQLLARGDEALAAKVRARWGSIRQTRDAMREVVIADMRRFLRSASGDPIAGVQIYKRVCGQCHKLHGAGEDVGPDITLNGRSSFEQLLSNVFDPSLVIGAAYQARTVVTQEGRVLTGLLVEDGDQRVVLKMQGGKQEAIPRSQIDEMVTSELSLMPEDLEKQLQPQELADLFAYLTLDKPPTDSTARKLPGSHVPRPRETSDPDRFAEFVGEIRPGLTAAHVGAPGLAIVAEHAGREGVLRTQPVHRQAPCILHGMITVPEDKRTRLVVTVSHAPQGRWSLTVAADRKELHQAIIGGDGGPSQWHTIAVDLSHLEGRKVDLLLTNAAADDAPAAAYWSQIDIISE